MPYCWILRSLNTSITFSISNINIPAVSKRLCYRCQSYLSPIKHPSPKPHHKRYIEEIKHQGSAENNGMVAPCVVRRHADACHSYSPRQHPEEVGAQCLIEIPARNCGQEDGCELVIKSVEYVTPVYCLSWGSF